MQGDPQEYHEVRDHPHTLALVRELSGSLQARRISGDREEIDSISSHEA